MLSCRIRKLMVLCAGLIVFCVNMIPVGAAETVTDIVQSDAKKTSVSVTWQGSSETSYGVYLYDTIGEQISYKLVNDNTVTFKGLTAGTRYRVKILSVTDTENTDVDSVDAVEVYTKPATVQEVGLAVWYPTVKPAGTTFPGYKSNRATIEWLNDDYSDGYQAVIYSLAGKKLKSYKVKSQSGEYCTKTFVIPKIKNKGFIVKIRGYKEIAGKIYYGTYSEEQVILPQASIRKITGTAKKRTIYWKKVTNATGYIVYRVRNGKLKKIKNLGKTISQYKVTGLKSGDGLAVAAKVKVNGKTYISTITWYVSQK